MKISSGKKSMPQRIIVYGPEGIGKSTLASKFPDPLVIDTEGSTYQIDVHRFDENPDSWSMLNAQIEFVLSHPTICKTLIIDTADWAEKLAKEYICTAKNWTSLSTPGWGEGFTELEATFGKMLNLLTQVMQKGINTVLVAHSQIRTFTKPDEAGSYDRYELKLEKKTAALIKEWSDDIIFVNYETFITKKDKQGKGTAVGGRRVMHFEHAPAWDAKNRWELTEESYPLNYEVIRPYIYGEGAQEKDHYETTSEKAKETPCQENQLLEKSEELKPEKKKPITEDFKNDFEVNETNVDPRLKQLMEASSVTLDDVMDAVYTRGYYPVDTPYENLDPQFIEQVLIGAWNNGLLEMILARKTGKQIEM